MSTSIIYHMFGARGYEYKRFLLCKGKIGYLIEKKKVERWCPHCGCDGVILKGFVLRWLKTLPQGPYRAVYLVVKVRRFHCPSCGSRHQEPIPVISSPKLHYTKHLERFVEALLEFATIQDVAHFCQMSWNTIKALDKRRLHRRKPKWKYSELEYIGFDEIYLGAKAKDPFLFV